MSREGSPQKVRTEAEMEPEFRSIRSSPARVWPRESISQRNLPFVAMNSMKLLLSRTRKPFSRQILPFVARLFFAQTQVSCGCANFLIKIPGRGPGIFVLREVLNQVQDDNAFRMTIRTLQEDVSQDEQRSEHPEGGADLLDLAGDGVDDHVADHTDHNAVGD